MPAPAKSVEEAPRLWLANSGVWPNLSGMEKAPAGMTAEGEAATVVLAEAAGCAWGRLDRGWGGSLMGFDRW
jgi:hypothetical protein